jgi:hypothetical protein
LLGVHSEDPRNEVFEPLVVLVEHGPIFVPEIVFNECPPVVLNIGVIVLEGWVPCDHDKEDDSEGKYITGCEV